MPLVQCLVSPAPPHDAVPGRSLSTNAVGAGSVVVVVVDPLGSVDVVDCGGHTPGPQLPGPASIPAIAPHALLLTTSHWSKAPPGDDWTQHCTGPPGTVVVVVLVVELLDVVDTGVVVVVVVVDVDVVVVDVVDEEVVPSVVDVLVEDVVDVLVVETDSVVVVDGGPNTLGTQKSRRFPTLSCRTPN